MSTCLSVCQARSQWRWARGRAGAVCSRLSAVEKHSAALPWSPSPRNTLPRRPHSWWFFGWYSSPCLMWRSASLNRPSFSVRWPYNHWGGGGGGGCPQLTTYSQPSPHVHTCTHTCTHTHTHTHGCSPWQHVLVCAWAS